MHSPSAVYTICENARKYDESRNKASQLLSGKPGCPEVRSSRPANWDRRARLRAAVLPDSAFPLRCSICGFSWLFLLPTPHSLCLPSRIDPHGDRRGQLPFAVDVGAVPKGCQVDGETAREVQTQSSGGRARQGRKNVAHGASRGSERVIRTSPGRGDRNP